MFDWIDWPPTPTTVLLSLAVALSVLGVVMLVMGIAGRRREVTIIDDDGRPGVPGGIDYAPARSRRQPRPVPLVLGLVFALIGGAGLYMIAREGLDSKRIDEWAVTKYPAGSFLGDLDSFESATRNAAKIELARRYENGSLPPDVERQLVERKLRSILGDPNDKATPTVGIVDVSLSKARRGGLIDDAKWGEYVAVNFPKSVRLPEELAAGEVVMVLMMPGIEEAETPAWMLLILDEITFAGKPVEPMRAVVVATNPEWKPAIVVEAPLDPKAAAGGAVGPPPPRTRVRTEDALPADLTASAGTHPFTARLRAFSFDPAKVPPPIASMELLPPTTQPATTQPTTQPTTRPVAAVIGGRLSLQQAEALSQQALGKHEWRLQREVRVRAPGEAPATQESDEE